METWLDYRCAIIVALLKTIGLIVFCIPLLRLRSASAHKIQASRMPVTTINSSLSPSAMIGVLSKAMFTPRIPDRI
jgi:hypothetical protein